MAAEPPRDDGIVSRTRTDMLDGQAVIVECSWSSDRRQGVVIGIGDEILCFFPFGLSVRGILLTPSPRWFSSFVETTVIFLSTAQEGLHPCTSNCPSYIRSLCRMLCKKEASSRSLKGHACLAAQPHGPRTAISAAISPTLATTGLLSSVIKEIASPLRARCDASDPR